MTKSEPVLLTPTDFSVGVQEVVLVKRKGGEPEGADMPDSARRDLYRFAQESMPAKELRFEVALSCRGTSFKVVCKRLYHERGKIVRLVFLDKGAPDPRKFGPKAADIIPVEVALWAASRAFSTMPEGGIIRHYFFDPTLKNPIYEVFDAPVEWKGEEAERMIFQKIHQIERALRLPLEKLPQCTDAERHAQKNDPFHKCRYYCRARTYCHQAKSIIHPEGDIDSVNDITVRG